MLNTYDTEKELSEELDNLLVEHKFEKPRKTDFQCPTHGFGMVIAVKEKPRVNFKLEIYPNETEEPHFKVTYQNTTCRFKITDCSPMKAEAEKGIPTPIKKIMKEIQAVWSNHKTDIIKAWVDTRPTSQNHGHQRIR